MSFKSETQFLLKSFFSWVKTQFRCDVKSMRTNNGSEFISIRFFLYSWHHFSTFLHLHTSTKWGYRAQTSSSLKCDMGHSFSCKLSYGVIGGRVSK